MAEFAGSAVGTENATTASESHVEPTDGGSVSLPDGFNLSDATFQTDGADLVLTSSDGSKVTVDGFFSQDNPPELIGADGAQISGDMATQLAGDPTGGEPAADPGVSAGTDGANIAANPGVITGTDGEPIGNVENLEGTVFAVRTDGTRVELKQGDAVFQGDIIESSGDGAVGILLADETTFSMGENGRIVLDEMVYNPATQEGSVGLSVVQGVFTFVSGQVAKTDPDAMTLDTPVATIGIRGTQVGIEMPEGQDMNVVLMEEADGFVGEVVIANNGGVQVMNGANQFTSVNNFDSKPTDVTVMDLASMVAKFATALKAIPKIHGNQNDFGTQEDLPKGEEGEGEGGEQEGALDEQIEELQDGEPSAEELAETVTEAGEGEGEGEGEAEGEGEEIDLEAQAAAEAEAAAAAAAAEAAQVAAEAAAAQAAAEAAAAAAAEAAAQAAADAAADAARRAAEEAARRAAEEAARRAAEAAAGADARQFAANAEALAVEARAAADAAQASVDQADQLVPDVTSDGLPAAVGGNLRSLVDQMNEALESMREVADASSDAATNAEGFAATAAEAASTAVGGAAFSGRDRAFDALKDTETAYEAATSESTVVQQEEYPNVQQLVAAASQEAHDEADRLAGLAEDANTTAQGLSTDAQSTSDQADISVANTFDTGRYAYGDEVDAARADLENLRVQIDETANSVSDAAQAALDAAGVARTAATNAGVGDEAFAAVDAGAQGLLDALDALVVLQGTAGADPAAVVAAEQAVADAAAAMNAAITTAISFTGEAFNQLDVTADALIDAQSALQLATDTFTELTNLANDLATTTDEALQTIADADWRGDVDGVAEDDFMDVGELNTTGQNIDGGAGDDTIFARAGDDVVTGGSGDDTIDGGTGNDLLDGGTGDDRLIGGDGNDELLGGEGDDVLIGGAGADILDGGDGIDLASYADSLEGVIVDLAQGTGLGGDAEGDTLTNIENLEGSAFDDTLIGDGGDNVFAGGAGSDTIVGGEGDDTVIIEGAFSNFTISRADDGTISVTSGLDGDTDTISGVEIIRMDDETIGIADAAVNEDTALSLDITGALGGDLDEADSIVISGAPAGSTLILADGGTVTADSAGSFTISPDQAVGVTITPPLNSDVDFSLTVSEVGTDGSQTGLGFIDVDVKGIADPADLVLNTADITDLLTSIPLDIDANLTDTDGSEVMSITIAGLPEGATLSAGQANDDGSWTLTQSELSDLSILSADGFDQSFSLSVTATTTELDGGDSTSVSGSLDVSIDLGGGGADAPRLDLDANAAGDQQVGAAAGDEDTAIVLDISAELTDPTETLSITLSDIPEGSTLGIVNPAGIVVDIPINDGVAEIPAGLLSLGGDVLLTPPPNSDEDFDLTVTATSTTLAGDSASTTGSISVDVSAIADEPTLQVVGATGDEDTAISLDIDANLTDTDGSESLSIRVGGVPAGAVLSAGVIVATDPVTGETTWELDPAAGDLDDLKVTPPEDSNVDFQLTVTATATEADGADTATTATQTIDVDVVGVADAPTLNVTIAQGVPGGISSEPAAADPTPDDSSQHQVIGTDGDDVIDGRNRQEFIDGGAGNDVIDGRGGADVIVGGDGDDIIEGGEGADDLFGGAGNDVLEGGEGSDEIYGGAGNDVIEGGEGADILSGGAGDDFIDGGHFHEGGEDGGHYHDGSSSDLVLFTGPRDNYFITQNDDGSFTVQDMFAGRDGTDTVINVEFFQFSDGVVTEESLLETNPTTFLLDIDAALTDTDGSETLSISVSGLPEGAFLTFGTKNDDGTWTLTPEEAAQPGLGIIVPHDVSADFQLSVSATSTENDGDTNTVSQTITIDADAAAPNLEVTNAEGDEDTGIPLDIAASLTDTDGSETLSINIDGVPDGATLASDGVALTANDDGSFTLTPDQLTNLTVTPPENSNEDFSLTVTATSYEILDGSAATVATLNVDVVGVADAPQAIVSDETGTEDQWIQLHLDSALTDTDGSESLSITIAGVPEGAILNPGTQVSEGVWTATPDQLPSVCILPPDDFSGDINMTLNVTSTENDGDAATTSEAFTVTVTAVADTPTVSVASVSGDEDTAIELDIFAALNDTDGSESLSISLGGVPEGSELTTADGTVLSANADGSYSLTTDDLAGLTLTPPENFSGSIPMTVTATATDGSDTATKTGSFSVDVAGVADAPTLNVTAAATGDEDSAIALDISAGLTDESETLSIEISGVPAGATLSAGTSVTNPDGTTTWTVDPGDLQGLTITPPQDSDVDFTLSVKATSQDGNSTAFTTGDITVTVDAVADEADLRVADAFGAEDTTISLDISAASTDIDGSETLSVEISGVPAGATLSAGTSVTNPDGTTTWTVDPADLGDLSVTPAPDSSVNFALSVAVTTTDGTDTTTVTDNLIVNVKAVADTPTMTVANAAGDEDTAIPLTITAASTDTDGSEFVSIAISGVPEGAALSAGTSVTNPDGSTTWTLTPEQLTGLTITPPANSDVDFDLTVAVSAADDADTATIVDTITVSVDAVADQPTLTVGDTTGDEDTAILLDITSALTDTDGSETLSIEISGVPAGATLSAGTSVTNPDGSTTWTVGQDDLGSLTISPPADFSGNMPLSVKATSTDGTSTAVQTGTMEVNVIGVADAPILDLDSNAEGEQHIGAATGTEDTDIPLDITAALSDIDGSETLSIEVVIDGVPNGAVLASGGQPLTPEADGTYVLTPEQLTGLTVTPPANSDEDFTLAVHAIATEQNGAQATTMGTIAVSVDPDADAPTLVVDATASGDEDTAIALDISSALTDTDGSETLSIEISGVPAGATLSAGTSATNPDGTTTWTVDPADLGNLKVTPAPDSDANFDLTVTATSTDGTDTASTTATIGVTVAAVADTPNVTVNNAQGNEDSAIALDLSAVSTDIDGSETVSVTIGGVPAGAVLTLADGSQVQPDGNGNVSLGGDQLSGVSLTPPLNFSGAIALTMAATVTDGQSQTTTEPTPFTITVDGVADDPTLNVGATASGDEDTAIALDISAAVTDESEVLSVTIAGVPAGAALSAGTSATNPDGTTTWTVDPGDLQGLKVTPAANSDADFDLTVTATSTDGTSRATTSGTIAVSVDPDADVPTLIVDETAGGAEDSAIALDISAALNDTDGSETLSIEIGGVPAGAALSAGTSVTNPDGTTTWTLSANDIAGGALDTLTVSPATDSNVDFDLTVTATSTDGTDTATSTATIGVDVTGVADAPTLNVTLGEGVPSDGGAGSTTFTVTNVDNVEAGYNNSYGYYVLDDNGNPSEGQVIWANVKETDGENFNFTVEGVDPDRVGFFLIPDGDRKNPGLEDGAPVTFQPDGNGGWSAVTGDGTVLTGQDASAYFSNPALNPDGFDHESDSATIGNQNWEDLFGGGDQDFNDANFDVASQSNPGTGTTTTFDLNITSALSDTDGSETLSITVGGMPTGATLSAGQSNNDGTWSVSPDDFAGLTVTVPNGSGEFNLTVAATATENDGDSITVNATVSGTVNESDTTAEAPTLTVDATAEGDEDTAIDLDISAALTDTDGSETLSVSIAGVPAGAELSAGTSVTNPDGTTTWTLSADDIAGGALNNLKVTPSDDSNEDFDLAVTATSTETASGDTATTTSTINVAVAGVADVPTLNVTVGDPTVVAGGPETVLSDDFNDGNFDGWNTTSLGNSSYNWVVSGGEVGEQSNSGRGFLGQDLGDEVGDGPFTISADIDPNAGNTNNNGVGFVFGYEDGDNYYIAKWEDYADGYSNQSTHKDFVLVKVENGQETQLDKVNQADLPDGFSMQVSVDDNGISVSVDGTVMLSAAGETPAIGTFGLFTDDNDGGVSYDNVVVEATGGGTGGYEYPLNIASGLNDIDGSETLSIVVGGIPSGGSLSVGTPNNDGTWTLTADQLADVKMTVLAGSENFSLTVTSTATENDGDTETVSSIVAVTVPVVETDTTAESPDLTAANVSGLEDNAIALNISAALTDTDGSETLSVSIAGVPAGAQLSAGTSVANADGSTTWTLSADDISGGALDNLTVTPADDSNVDFDLSVTATSTETSSGATSTSTATVTVDVTGVADTPTVFAQAAENEVANYPDAVATHDPVAYWRFEEIDDDTMVDTAGAHNGEYHRGAESKTGKEGVGSGAGDFDGKNDYVHVNHSSDFELPSGSITLWFNSDDVDDRQGLFSKDSSGFDDGGHLTGYVDDGEVKVRLQSGEDSFWVDGGSLSDNTWHQVTFNWGEGGMELYVDGELVDSNAYTGGIEDNTEPLVIGANAWASDDGSFNNRSDYFDGQIDEFSIMAQPLSASQVSSLYNSGGTAIVEAGGDIGGTVSTGLTFDLEISGALGDTDGSETLSVVVSGVPSGVALSAGMINDDGSYTLTTAELSGLQLTTDHTVIENFELTVTGVASENDGDIATSSMILPIIVDDTIDANVSITGSSGDDLLIGGTGDDVLTGRGGDDELLGGGGADTLFGSSGNDTMDGGSGEDTMFGSSGRDVMDGGAGNDYMDGGSSNDTMDGGAGNDVMVGGSGDDVMRGGAGNDTLEGGRDDDVLYGGAGDDVLEGGEGADTFMFDSESGHDIITDILQQDVLVFEGQEFHMDDLQLSENDEGDVVIAFGGVEDTSVTLSGVSIEDLDQNNDGDPSDGYSVTEEDGHVSITIDSQ